MIPIIVPLGRTYGCSVSGTTFKFVRCEQCQNYYVYRMTRTGSGSATQVLFIDAGASDVAGMQAHAQLQRKLDEECDPVPCRTCGHYQENMVAVLKRHFQGRQFQAGKVMLGLTVPMAAVSVIAYLGRADWSVALIFLPIAAVFALTGSLLLAIRAAMLPGYEPNERSLEERMEIAAVYAKTLDEFRAWLAERGVTIDLSALAAPPAPPPETRIQADPTPTAGTP